MIEVHYLDSSKEALLGQDHSAKNRVIVTFSERNRVQTCHNEQPDCSACRWKERRKRRPLDEADERDVRLSSEERELPPSNLVHTIFSKIIQGLMS